MRSRLAFIMSRTKQAMDNSTITIRWTETTGGTDDPLTGSKVNGTVTNKSETTKALIHFVGPATSGFRVHNEIAVGDAIVDIDPTFDIVDKEDLTFEFGNSTWVQKEVGRELAKSWDVLFGDQLISRTLLLTRKQ